MSAFLTGNFLSGKRHDPVTMKLIHKLITGFLIVALLIWVTGYFALEVSKKILEERFKERNKAFAFAVLHEVDEYVQGKIEIFQAYCRDELLRETLTQSNHYFEGLDNMQKYITDRDREWIASKDKLTPFIQGLLNNKLSRELRKKIGFYKEKYGYNVIGEAFVTNKYGATVALTNKTTDYQQNDEEWWHITKNTGLYVKDVAKDESADMYTVDIALRIDDHAGNFIGVLKAVLNIQGIMNILDGSMAHESHKAEYSYTKFKLITRGGRLIYSSDNKDEFFTDVSYLFPISEYLTHGPEYSNDDEITITEKDGRKLFIVHAHSSGFKEYRGLGWILILEYDANEVFAPVTELRNRILAISFSVTVLAVLLGIFISSHIVHSVKRLRDAAIQIGKGDLDTEIDIKSNDEIGQLAREFKHMTQNLKSTTVRLDEFAKEVADRKRIEEQLRQSRQDWIDTFNTITDIITIHDRDYNIIRANKAAEKVLKLPDSPLLKGIKCFRHYHGTDKPPEGCPSCNCYNTGKPAVFEIFEPHLNSFVEIRSIPRLNSNNEIIGLIHVVRDISKRKRNEELIKMQLDRLNALRSIDKAIISSIDLRTTLDIFLDQVITRLKVDAASVLLLNKQTQILEYVVSKGFRSGALKYTKLRLGESNAGIAAIERRIVTIPNLKENIDGFASSRQFVDEDFISYFAVPLVARGQVRGVLELFHRSLLRADPDWMGFLEAVADQGAIAIDNATLFDELQRSNVELALAYDTTIEGWSHAMDLRDRETVGHSRRVTEMTIRIAREMGIKEDMIVHIRRGALLHDVGKIGVPDTVLLKPGPLTEEEWAIMKRHPEHAYNMLYPIEYLRPALDIPYCHHEKWDGSGYPRGLREEEIPIAARIFAVVDVWDALISDRPYRPAWPKDKVIEHIRSLAGIHFDPEVVEVFLRIVVKEAEVKRTD